ncbi:hypothetical protein KEF29_10885 [Streptomyces tuirus]|uniref:Uncharacterized protein n=1 Tax=Streptomyces tuirus TaxID=68278 RepID=A0A941J545_9ACTN|nr:hypothetical protein [Streptomyces tuirus]
MIREIEVSSQLPPGPARDLHVVAAEPQNVLQRHAFSLAELLLLENGVGDVRQAVVGAGVQAGHQALVLGVAHTGRGKAEALAQRRQLLRGIAPVQREEHAVDQTPQPSHVHLAPHPTMMSDARTRFHPARCLVGRQIRSALARRPFTLMRMSHESIHEHLLISARKWARTAVDAYLEEPIDQDFAVHHMAVAVEHASKAYLASISPVLLASEKQPSVDDLLVLSGNEDKTKKGRAGLKTIGGEGAILRADQLLGPKHKTPARLKELRESRNGITHMGWGQPVTECRELLAAGIEHIGFVRD